MHWLDQSGIACRGGLEERGGGVGGAEIEMPFGAEDWIADCRLQIAAAVCRLQGEEEVRKCWNTFFCILYFGGDWPGSQDVDGERSVGGKKRGKRRERGGDGVGKLLLAVGDSGGLEQWRSRIFELLIVTVIHPVVNTFYCVVYSTGAINSYFYHTYNYNFGGVVFTSSYTTILPPPPPKFYASLTPR